jgi:hypothetical protein
MSSSTFRTCPDGHRCENGSSCAQHPMEEGTYYCDCGTSPGDFAGLYCEYEAETYCQLQQETTSNWFCSNQGTCVLSTTGGGTSEAQWTCDCPTDFDGPVSLVFYIYIKFFIKNCNLKYILQKYFFVVLVIYIVLKLYLHLSLSLSLSLSLGLTQHNIVIIIIILTSMSVPFTILLLILM